MQNIFFRLLQKRDSLNLLNSPCCVNVSSSLLNGTVRLGFFLDISNSSSKVSDRSSTFKCRSMIILPYAGKIQKQITYCKPMLVPCLNREVRRAEVYSAVVGFEPMATCFRTLPLKQRCDKKMMNLADIF